MKLILHIGTEKTGSTSIQAFLAQNRKLLAEYGYWVPETLGKYNHRRLPSSFMTPGNFDDFHKSNNTKTKEEFLSFREEVIREFSEEIRNLPTNIKNVVISSEHFHSRLVRDDEIKNLKNRLDDLFDDYEVLVYLRRQIDMATSLYSTALKSGKVVEDINFFIERITGEKSHYFNYRIFLEKWERIFGNLRVRIFEKNDLYMNDIINDFVLTIFEDKYNDIIDKAQEVKKANESLNVFGQNLMNIINKYLDNKEILKYMRRQINNKCLGEGKKPAYDVAKRVMDRYRESNEEVRALYFKERKNLFDENLDKYRSLIIKEDNGEIEMLESLVKLLARIPREDDIDKIRNIAVSLEEIDINKSLELMEILHYLRPDGKYIGRKLKKYNKIIHSEI